MQFDSRHLAALSAILRLGSFESAAGALGITQSAVSQRLKALEEQVGTVLVLRESPCRGTGAGRRLAAHAEAVALLEAQTSTDLGRDGDAETGAARLRIAVNADSLATWLLGGLSRVSDLLFDIVLDDESRSAEWLRRGEVLAAVCEQSRPVQGCDVHPLGTLRYIATASPDFVDRWFSDGVNAETLARAPMLQFNAKDSLQSQWLDAQFGARADPAQPRHALVAGLRRSCPARHGLGHEPRTAGPAADPPWHAGAARPGYRHLRQAALLAGQPDDGPGDGTGDPGGQGPRRQRAATGLRPPPRPGMVGLAGVLRKTSLSLTQGRTA